jgi:hypothetical protein
MKLFCKTCGHRCHCLGQGYYVSETYCDSCSCNACMCKPVEPLILTKPKRSKKFEFYTIIILMIIILGIGLLGCSKEKYPNKMDSIAKALSNIKK